MSHIEASRMPHAYAPAEEQDISLRTSVSDAAKRAGDTVQAVPPLGWVVALVGAGAVGAGIYAAFFREEGDARTRRRTAATRKPRAANAGTRKPRPKAAANA